VDPDTTAETADVFWHPKALHNAVPVLAHHPRTGMAEAIDVDLRQLTSLRRVLIDPTGVEHVFLKVGWASITLRNQGASLLDTPACLTFLTHGIAGIASAPRLLHRARALLGPASALNSELTTPPADWIDRKRKAILALDAHEAGASVREIAALLYGKEWTDSAWRTNRKVVRQAVSRAIAHATELAYRRYLDLLA
jgi:hypothetical protein